MNFPELKHKKYFITAIGTDVGKTYFATNLYKNLIKNNKKANIIKPVISGFDLDNENDTLTILKTLNLPKNLENINKISPFRLKYGLSPDIAAQRESIKLNFNEIGNFCLKNIENSQKKDEILLIEGAGGIMSPIIENKTFLDLIKMLEIPVILVINNYLGAISHFLTSLQVLQQNNIDLSHIILNFRDNNLYSKEEFMSSLGNFCNYNITSL